MNLVRLYSKHPLFFKLALILLVSLINIILFEKKINKCNSMFGKFLIVFHRVHSIFVWTFPFLFGFYRLHLLYVILIGTSWIYNDGRCTITVFHNDLCEIEEKHDDGILSRLTNYLGIDPYYQIFFGLFALSAFDLYMIYNGH